jgi:hypothetical protein
MTNPDSIIIDAHEDLSMKGLADGRDYMTSAHAIRKMEAEAGYENPYGTCMLGLADWLEARVAVIFATLQTMPTRRQSGRAQLCHGRGYASPGARPS